MKIRVATMAIIRSLCDVYSTLFSVISLDKKWKMTLVQKCLTVVFHILKRQIRIMTYNKFDFLHVKSLQLSLIK